MTIVIEEDDTPSGDEWAASVAQDHTAEERWLEDRKREFLERGGQIEQVPMGLCSRPPEMIKYGALSHNDQYSFAEQVEMRTAKARDAVNSRTEADEKAASALDLLLDTAQTVLWLTQCTGFSSDKVNRLLRQYFAHDPRAVKFQPVAREDRLGHAMQAAKRAKASGQVGVGNVARASGVSKSYLRKLMREEGLYVPCDTPGRKKGITAPS